MAVDSVENSPLKQGIMNINICIVKAIIAAIAFIFFVAASLVTYRTLGNVLFFIGYSICVILCSSKKYKYCILTFILLFGAFYVLGAITSDYDYNRDYHSNDITYIIDRNAAKFGVFLTEKIYHEELTGRVLGDGLSLTQVLLTFAIPIVSLIITKVRKTKDKLKQYVSKYGEL